MKKSNKKMKFVLYFYKVYMNKKNIFEAIFYYNFDQKKLYT